ncbi:hypothetical protein R1sor_020508 [Riccia sorocarpa]|uniref:Thymidylate kinase-like domain-containing protein n=1 Tax=Riccia sorocarpa TaxID=122646 RepID=A0ABD3IGB2_9MARC
MRAGRELPGQSITGTKENALNGIFDSSQSKAISNGRRRSSSRSCTGALIVLEGLDRSGKSSQSRALASFLRESVVEWEIPRPHHGNRPNDFITGLRAADLVLFLDIYPELLRLWPTAKKISN